MKIILSKTTALIAICLCAHTANASVGTRGGGNIAAAQFGDLANSAVIKLTVHAPITINSFVMDLQKLRTTVQKMKVFTVDRPLSLNGKVVQAVNDPQTLEITFNKIAWSKMNLEDRTQLVLHELLGLSFPEISDTGYVYSRRLLELLNINSQNPEGSDVQAWLKQSPAVKGLTSGVEAEYQVTCEAYQLTAYDSKGDMGAAFEATANCYSKNPWAESGLIIKIKGAAVDGSPMIIDEIKINTAG